MSKITLYHYTNESNAQSINKHKVIYGSTDETPKQHRRFGKGVYFTSIDPSNDLRSILLNNFDDAGRVINSGRLRDKTEWVIEVSIPRNEVEKVPEDNRDVYVYRGHVDLTLYKHRIYPNPRR
ncbi:uncharacterized protein LOC116289084 [Actinia tenebrosa]|uniref:Uncharacterized protein LOC116289084 n=1 Tax=Actinia tenebrosa TaxID=6105 RepID=A0A6P8H626_ACTTE|nr:uncharacterized protein LOC116289084 [Actinia tenebrosa]